MFNSLSPTVAVDLELPFFEGEFFSCPVYVVIKPRVWMILLWFFGKTVGMLLKVKSWVSLVTPMKWDALREV
ncbi:hypothetical protein SMIM3I_02238 [Streptococcus mitis]|uniref:Uncharacterized protein n=1 Tax=Streptococcus mitis TaxID=28037 RepID=A0A150NTA9_STRMT|nr:hypothetical protein SMIM3I_02238 [Streptococcus mitis]